MDEEESGALPEEEKAAVDKMTLARSRSSWLKSLRRKRSGRRKRGGGRRKRRVSPWGSSLQNQRRGKPNPPEKKKTKAPEKKTKPPEKKETKIPTKKETKAPEKGETEAPEQEETEIPEDPAAMEKNLHLRFQIYESSQQNITQVFSYWDRVQGSMQLPAIQKGNKTQPSAKSKGQKTNKPQEKVEKKPAQKRGDHRSLRLSQQEAQSKVPAEGAVRDQRVGVLCLDIPVTDPKAMFMEVLRSGRLPLGASGLGRSCCLRSSSISSCAGSWEGRCYLSHQEGLWLSDYISYLDIS
ncbi:hypothetical protein HGM15179_020884 [Zosterops borbonicus]|uniref:Uncharacterized protein n=1 Tax=Zosterops borbonicus TaxID=364589 RepID=A0A8K1D8D6_9PASS|nr:hypothetical protein HGM15179_020884 [Zosterops borbonicus]